MAKKPDLIDRVTSHTRKGGTPGVTCSLPKDILAKVDAVGRAYNAGDPRLSGASQRGIHRGLVAEGYPYSHAALFNHFRHVK